MRVLRGDKGRRRGKDDCQPGFYLWRHSCEDEKGAILEECSQEERKMALESLALFATIEINAPMNGPFAGPSEADPDLFLAGSPAPLIKERVAELLGKDVGTLGICSAAKGCACIAKDVFAGCKNIMGLEVDERVREV